MGPPGKARRQPALRFQALPEPVRLGPPAGPLPLDRGQQARLGVGVQQPARAQTAGDGVAVEGAALVVAQRGVRPGA